MTEALVAFYQDNEHKISAHYNSDGYPSYIGKIVSDHFSKTSVYDSFCSLVGSYMLNTENWVQELLYDKPNCRDSGVDYVYSLHYNSELKKVERVTVESYKDSEIFTGDVTEYSEWIKKDEG